MTTAQRLPRTHQAARRLRALSSMLACLAVTGAALAQAPSPAAPASPLATAELTWQQCQRLAGNDTARLACFDRWAQQQTLPAAAVPAAPPVLAAAQPDGEPPRPVDASVPATRVIAVGGDGCRDRQYSELSRFWELETGTGCGTFGFRGYRPLNVSLATATDRPGIPDSPAPGHLGSAMDYQRQEMRIGLSVRTKLAQNLLTRDDPSERDSLWFGYTQQSSWQVFNGTLSRPFRTTDHEPELIYAYPLDVQLPGGWRWRYAGAGLVHQSNGQSLPYSRSWNRLYLMGGLELDHRFRVTMRAWRRLPENAASDDNPDIADYIGRAEVAGFWNLDGSNTLGLTVRNSLKSAGRGSVRLEWLRAFGDRADSNLRFHAQLFHGYGDTLIDYNRRRTVLSIGLSLVDF